MGKGLEVGPSRELQMWLEPPWELRQLSPLVVYPGLIVEGWA